MNRKFGFVIGNFLITISTTTIIMTTFKRKAPNSKPHEGNDFKKSKKDTPKSQSQKDRNLETETDSDPIVESDTTDHSGDDDGVSWPSDEEGVPLEELSMEEEGGVKLLKKSPTKSTDAKGPLPSNDDTKNANICKTPITVRTQFLIPSIARSSKEAHAKQKAITQERRAAKPNADSIARSMKIWERLRRKSHVPLAERKELVSELFDIVTGRVKDFVFKHDSVRVIQTALKYANIDQRKMIAKELKGEYRGLAESRYAKFLVGKIIVHGDTEIRDLVVPEFYGHVRRMIKHPEASWILDDIYRGSATSIQKAHLLREWYGPEFAIFKNDGQASNSADLKELLKKYPEKRTPIMHSLHELINGLVQKKSTGFTMLHDAMLQYFLNVQPGGEENREFIELLKSDEEGDLLKNLAFTKSGARIVCLALAYGTAKDRKLILKMYKKTFQTMASDPCGHQVLLAIYDVVDDTVLTSKSVFPELISKDPSSENQNQALLESAVDLNARIALLYPFSGISKAILPKEDLALLDEIHRIRTTTSKKDPEVRRQELAASLSPSLLSCIATNAEALAATSFGCQFITEVLLGAIAGDRSASLTAIAALAAHDNSPVDWTSPAAGRMLKALVLGGRFNPSTQSIDRVAPPLGFHDVLYTAISEDRVLDWATGENSFVVVGLLEAEGFTHARKLRATLKKRRNQLLAAANCPAAVRKDGVPLKGKKVASAARGNKGTQILLQKLDA